MRVREQDYERDAAAGERLELPCRRVNLLPQRLERLVHRTESVISDADVRKQALPFYGLDLDRDDVAAMAHSKVRACWNAPVRLELERVPALV